MEWCEEYRKLCLDNYDRNMMYFDRLDEASFNEALDFFCSGIKDFPLSTICGVIRVFLAITSWFSMNTNKSISANRLISPKGLGSTGPQRSLSIEPCFPCTMIIPACRRLLSCQWGDSAHHRIDGKTCFVALFDAHDDFALEAIFGDLREKYFRLLRDGRNLFGRRARRLE